MDVCESLAPGQQPAILTALSAVVTFPAREAAILASSIRVVFSVHVLSDTGYLDVGVCAEISFPSVKDLFKTMLGQ